MTVFWVIVSVGIALFLIQVGSGIEVYLKNKHNETINIQEVQDDNKEV